MKKDNPVQRSFAREWKHFNPSNKIWGLTNEEREEIFLSDMDIPDRGALENKLLLDAGCGTGILDLTLGDLGLKVIGMDFTPGFLMADDMNTNVNVNFIKGDLNQAPFCDGTFDLIYCSGVLHHTPHPEESFQQLSRLVKNDGKLFIWVYGGEKLERSIYKRFLQLHVLTSRLPPIIQDTLYTGISVMFQAIQILVRGRSRMWDQTWAERQLWVRDILSHRYQSIHSKEGVKGWFEKENFTDLKITDRLKWGFGMCGRKSLPNRSPRGNPPPER
jgi:SAM-dependent methyltransferase